jgi:hypothetical protein
MDQIQYIFKVGDRDVSFNVDTDPNSRQFSEGELPEWAQLNYRQCRNCSIDEADCVTCAMALRAQRVVETFGSHVSTERVHVSVKTPQREFSRECDLQTGIQSLMGLLMATCGCSHFEPLRILVNFHIPFCTTEETLRRVAGAYLTEQYFVMKDGGKPDWELKGLTQIFTSLAVVNQDFVRRLQGTMEKDAVNNAILGYFASSSLLAADFEGQMARHRPYLLNRH